MKARPLNEDISQEATKNKMHFPVPDFFESFDTLTIEKVIKRLNNFDTQFLQVDIIGGAEQITIKHIYGAGNTLVGRNIIFTLPGRMETNDKEQLVAMAKEAGWDGLNIKEQSFGFNSYTKFYLTRKFG